MGRLTRLAAILRPSWVGYGLGLVGVALVSAAIGAVQPSANGRSDFPLYLIVVLTVAALYGRGPAVVAAVAANLAADQLFVGREPGADDATPWLRLLPFLVTALVTGQLAATLRQQAEDARRREREAVALYEVVRLVPSAWCRARRSSWGRSCT